MAQCVGRSQRTGERCRRRASGDASTCHYHGPAAAPARRSGPPRTAASASPAGDLRGLTTAELSPQTLPDFETLFAEGTGWGRCGCLFALQAPRATRGTWAHQRERNLCTMRALVEEGRSDGVLVYDGGAPVGWCQFVAREDLRRGRIDDASSSAAAWFVTCFVIEPRARGRGVTGVALRAAVDAIRRRGGGVVEGHATPMVPGPAPKAARQGTYLDGDLLFGGGAARARFGYELEGLGPVTALYRSRRSMHGAPLGGTVDLYRREGFEAVAVAPRRPTVQLADRVIMRRTV